MGISSTNSLPSGSIDKKIKQQTDLRDQRTNLWSRWNDFVYLKDSKKKAIMEKIVAIMEAIFANKEENEVEKLIEQTIDEIKGITPSEYLDLPEKNYEKISNILKHLPSILQELPSMYHISPKSFEFNLSLAQGRKGTHHTQKEVKDTLTTTEKKGK